MWILRGLPWLFLTVNDILRLTIPKMLLLNDIGAGGLPSSPLVGKQAGEAFQLGLRISPTGELEAQMPRLPLPQRALPRILSSMGCRRVHHP